MSVKKYSLLAVSTLILAVATACSKAEGPSSPAPTTARDTKIPIYDF